MKTHDLTGRVFGSLTALRRAENRNGKVVWLCSCSCGNTKVIRATHLLQGFSTTCGGCVGALANRREYTAWRDMHRRCSEPTNPRYPTYGARGIYVCARWQNFKAFLADMGPCPDGHSLDRIDNNGNYDPANCRWATDEQQRNNKRSNRRITIDGRTQTLAQWIRERGLKFCTVRNRLYRKRLTPEEALR